jgi:hypothetical protein
MERLRENLDQADPGWRNRPDAGAIVWPRVDAHPERGLGVAALLFGFAVLFVILAWQGRVHWSLLERRWRG